MAFTLTFGDNAENHVGMQKIGKDAEEGLSYENLQEIYKYFSSLDFKCDFYNLNELIECPAENAYFLVIKNCLRKSKKLKNELLNLEWDKKAFMKGRVVNKKARYNLCFSDFDQDPDYENGKGRVYDYNKLKYLKKLKSKIDKIMRKCNIHSEIQCEGNYYYDTKSCFISPHGDYERKIVVGVRLGEDFPFYYQWYQNSKKIGNELKIILSDGDMYFMSSKAVGKDWHKKIICTLRHAAGYNLP